MSVGIDVNTVEDIVGAVVDMLTIVLIGWAGWEALFHRNIQGAMKRAVTGIALFAMFNYLAEDLFFTTTQDTSQMNANALYSAALGPMNTTINPILGGGFGQNQPGLGLITQGFKLSNAMWSGINTYNLIEIPIAFCVIMWAIEIAKGATWLSIGMKVLLWTLLYGIVAGPVTGQFPMFMLNTASSFMASVTTALTNQNTATPPGPIVPTWDDNNVSLARNNAQCPVGLDGLVAPYIGSCNRSLPQAALAALKSNNYVGEGAPAIVSNLFYTDPTGEATDPKAALQLSTPATNTYQLLYVNANPTAWITNHFLTADGTIMNGAGITVGFIKLGANADASPGIITAYKAAKDASVNQLQLDIAQLQSSNASPIAIQQKTQLKTLIEIYVPPNVVPISTIPAITNIQNYITNYYSTIDATRASKIISTIDSTNKDAWGLLWFNSAGKAAMSTYMTSINSSASMSTPLMSWAGNPNIQSAMMRDESGAATPNHEFSIWQLGTFIKGLITLIFMSIAETGMAFLVLILKILVYVAAPIISYGALYCLSLGIFILAIAYPCAAFISLFPGRSSILLDWTKGVFWVMTWAPIMTAGIMMCSFNASDLGTAAMAVLKAIPGLGIAASASASAIGTVVGSNNIMGAGLVTDSFMQTIIGILLIFSSPLIANLVFNPGLGGIAGLTASMAKNIGGQVAGAGLAPISAVGGGLAAGAKAGLAGAGKLVSQAAEGLNRSAPALGNGTPTADGGGSGGSPAGGGVLGRVQASLGGGASWASSATGALRSIEDPNWGTSVGATATGALQRAASKVGGEGSTLRSVAEAGAGLGGRLVTGAATALSTMERASSFQGRQQRAGMRAMVNPTGLTPITARGAQATAAAMGGDLETAQSLGQGKGEHISDLDFRRGQGGAGSPGGTAGRGRAGSGASGGGSPGPAATGGEVPSQGTPIPTTAKGGFGVSAVGQSKAGAVEARQRLVAGALALPEQRKELEGKALQAAARATSASNAGNVHEAVGSSIEAMNLALDSGNAGQAARASQLYENMAAREGAAMEKEGMVPHQRPLADGMARGARAAARDEMVAGARSAGQQLPAALSITSATDPSEQDRSAKRAQQALATAGGQEATATPLDQRMATAREAMVQAVRSGDAELISQARELAVGTAYEVSMMDAQDPERPAAMREAGIALAAMEPYEQSAGQTSQSGGASQRGGGQVLSSEGGADYRAAVGVARNGNNLIESVRRPEPGLVRSTVQGGTSALSIARFANSAGQIAESGEHIQRVAAAALRMDVGEVETPMVQIEVAEALVQASQGFDQAAGLHDTYAADLIEAASQEESPVRQESLIQQAGTHANRAETLRTQATTTHQTATKVASTAMTSARIGLAMSGGEARVARMNQVHHRAEQIISGGHETVMGGSHGDEGPAPFLEEDLEPANKKDDDNPDDLPPPP